MTNSSLKTAGFTSRFPVFRKAAEYVVPLVRPPYGAFDCTVESSLYATLETAGRPVARALQHVSAVNAGAELARLAEVPEGQALLQVTRLGYLVDGTPAELTVTYCRTDYYDLIVELTR